MRLRMAGLLLVCLGCAGARFDERDSDGADTANARDVTLSESDFSQVWYRLAPPGELPPDAYQIVEGPNGYWARWAADVSGDGQGKTVPLYESALYHSDDGRSWTEIDIEQPDSSVGLRGLASGNGRYVLIGSGVFSDYSLLRTSNDGLRWTEQRFGVNVADGPGRLRSVHYVGDRFFALSDSSRFLTSINGSDWQVVETLDTWQQKDVAFGAGRYVLAGNGRLQVSEDGLQWRALDAQCELPCCTETGSRPYFLQVVFGNDYFRAKNYFNDDSLLVHSDGTLSCEGSPAAVDVVAGYFASRPDDGKLEVWRAGEPEKVVNVDEAVPPGLTCRAQRCLVIDGALLLAP